MNITIYALHLSYGGVEKAITNMANIFSNQYDVEIVCLYDMPNAPAYELDNKIKVSYLLNDIPNKEEFISACRAKNPYRILKQGLKAVKILYLKKAKLKKHMKLCRNCIVITTRHEDTVLLNKYKNDSIYAIAQLHHDHFGKKKLLKQIINQYRKIDTLCLLSDELKNEIKQMLPSDHPLKCITIPNFLDSIPDEYEFDRKKRECIAVGRLHQVKGFSRMISIFSQINKQVSDYKLRIIGDGEQFDDLKQLIKKLNLEEIIILEGRKNSIEIEQANKNASIYLMTSFSEGLPLVLMEAQSCSLPIVAFDVRVGPRSIVTDKISGFLVPDGDDKEFVDRVLELICDDELRRKMSHAAYLESYRFEKERVSSLWYKELKIGEERVKNRYV